MNSVKTSNKILSQKEYLKKYLSKTKKKHKKRPIGRSNVKVIDDNELSSLHVEENEELETGEDAPLIAAFIDERPTTVKRLELYSAGDRWAPVPEVNGDLNGKSHQKKDNTLTEDRHSITEPEPATDSNSSSKGYSKPSKKEEIYSKDSSISKTQTENSDKEKPKDNVSSKRKKSRFEERRSVTPLKSRPVKTTSDSKKYEKEYNSSARERQRERQRQPSDDRSPLPDSKKSQKEYHSSVREKQRERRKYSSDDRSPSPDSKQYRKEHDSSSAKEKRRHNRERSTDGCSLTKRMKYDEKNEKPKKESRNSEKKFTETFPPKKSKTTNRKSRSHSPKPKKQKKYSSDSSPSPSRHRSKNKEKKKLATKRKKRQSSSSDTSSISSKRDHIEKESKKGTNFLPKKKRKEKYSSDSSSSSSSSSSVNTVKQKRKKDRDLSAIKKKHKVSTKIASPNRNKEKKKEKSNHSKKTKRKHSSDSSSVDGKPERRREKSAKVERNENVDDKKSDELKKPTAEQYYEWGKGLKQIEDENEKLASDLHEMTKPLARYADDEDLDKHLKDMARDEDPFALIKPEKYGVDSKDSKPRYKGAFPPNRFGIAPGHKWDGVDRSNGYELKWLGKAKSKEATEEEAYKWSTADM